MSADQQDMINHLMMQAAMTPQGPSLYGLQSQVDPNTIQALLGKMKQQQVLDQANAPTGGQYGYLHDAGKAAFNSIGSSLGGQLAAFGNGPSQGPSPQIQAQRAAITAGNQGVSSDLAGGVDPEQAKINALTKAAQAGLPGAAQALDLAVEAQQKTATAKASAFKDTAQGNAATDEIQNRAQQRDLAERTLANTQSKDTYKVVANTSTHQVLENGLGDRKSIELNPSANAPPSADQLANEASVAKLMADGKIPLPSARQLTTPAGQRLLSAATAINPNLSTADNKTLTENAHAFSPNGVQGKAISSFNVALNHGAELESIVNGLNNGDVQAVNKAKNLFGDKFGNSTGPVAMQLAAHLYGDEVEKTIISTGGTADERAAIGSVFSNVRTPDQLAVAVATANKLLVGKVQNSRQIYGVSGLPGSFEEKYLGPRAKELVAKDADYQQQFGAKPTAAPQAAPPGSAAGGPPAGWTLHTDAKGNKAYVSPDGKQFQDAQ
jgi:hypothetical protein